MVTVFKKLAIIKLTYYINQFVSHKIYLHRYQMLHYQKQHKFYQHQIINLDPSAVEVHLYQERIVLFQQLNNRKNDNLL